MKYVDSFSFDYYKKYKQGKNENEIELSLKNSCSEVYTYCAETLTLAQIIFFANKHFIESMPQIINYVDEIFQSVSAILASSLNQKEILIDYDNLVEGVKFHLYGTSLSGLAVDEYAVTDAKGVAKFENVLISGTTPYTIEEVDTAVWLLIRKLSRS